MERPEWQGRYSQELEEIRTSVRRGQLEQVRRHNAEKQAAQRSERLLAIAFADAAESCVGHTPATHVGIPFANI